MIDTFIYDNLFHIIGGLIVIIFSKQIATSTKSLSGAPAFDRLGDPRIFIIIGVLWILFGVLTFTIPLFL